METENLLIEPSTVEQLEKLQEGEDSFEKQFGQKVMEGYLEWPEVMNLFIDKLKNENMPPEWWNYLIIHKRDNALIGMCGFKGAPDSEGIVEIGYGISREYRNKGYATEAASALINHALANSAVKAVCAHTLIELNASGRVLEKCGMKLTGEAFDPEDGRVWRWEIQKQEKRQ